MNIELKRDGVNMLFNWDNVVAVSSLDVEEFYNSYCSKIWCKGNSFWYVDEPYHEIKQKLKLEYNL